MDASLNSSSTRSETALPVSLHLAVLFYRSRQELHPHLGLCKKTDFESLSLFPLRLGIHQPKHRALSDSINSIVYVRLSTLL